MIFSGGLLCNCHLRPRSKFVDFGEKKKAFPDAERQAPVLLHVNPRNEEVRVCPELPEVRFTFHEAIRSGVQLRS